MMLTVGMLHIYNNVNMVDSKLRRLWASEQLFVSLLGGSDESAYVRSPYVASVRVSYRGMVGGG